MGNQNCEQCRQIKNQNTAYGEYEVCHEDGKQLALIQKKVSNKQGLADKISLQLEKRTNIKSKHVVRLHKFNVVDCGYEVHVSLFYEFMPRTLREYLLDLKLRGEEMNEKGLFGLIYGVELGLQALYNLGATHNCVNLDTILCRNGYFKITDVSATTNLTSYSMVLQGDRQQFLSEQLLNNLSCTMIKPVGSSINDDYFSLALIVLMIVSGSTPQHFYIWHKSNKILAGSFNTKHIEYCMRLLARNYSSKLVAKIKELLALGQAVEKDKEGGSLTAQLQDLQEDMSRVLNKIKNSTASKDTTLRNSYYQTPFRPYK